MSVYIKNPILHITTVKGFVGIAEYDGKLETLQALVGGYIEPCAPVELREKGIELVANEEGLFQDREPNENLYPFFFVGDVVAIGVDGEDFAPLTGEQIQFMLEWLEVLN